MKSVKAQEIFTREDDWIKVVRCQPLNNVRPEGQTDGDGQDDEDVEDEDE